MPKPSTTETLTPFRLHYSDGTTADIDAENPNDARKLGDPPAC